MATTVIALAGVIVGIFIVLLLMAAIDDYRLWRSRMDEIKREYGYLYSPRPGDEDEDEGDEGEEAEEEEKN